MSFHAGYAALIGRPNVGKSTLMNRLLGQKLAITSHKPQTTRHAVLGIHTSADMQVVFVDTPGMHQRGQKALNKYLNRSARNAMEEVDLCLFVVEAGRWTPEDDEVARYVENAAAPCLVVVNKIDNITPREALLPYLQLVSGHCPSAAGIIPLSAGTGENCTALLDQIQKRLPESEPIFPEDQITDRPERFFAAELIREQLTRRFHKEIPYSVSVEIEQFKRLPGGLLRISALVWVERESQRGILIGKQGSSMKEAATAARQELIRFFGGRVQLKIWVKVKRSWASDQASLQRLGYVD